MDSSLKVLLTGTSGYLGGTLLTQLINDPLPGNVQLFAPVRTDEQAKAVAAHATPLRIDLSSAEQLRSTILDNEINVVYWLVNAFNADSQVPIIKALGELKRKTGKDVHFLHTTGAKLFSSHAGQAMEQGWTDDGDVWSVQNSSNGGLDPIRVAKEANNTVIRVAEEHDVKAYIFIPCIVYGKGLGYGNKTSIQTVAVTKVIRAVGKVYAVDEGNPVWPVSHVEDTASLYKKLLEKIALGVDLDHGRNGYYLASSGRVVWKDLYAAIGKALLKRNLIEDAEVGQADQTALEQMSKAMECNIPMLKLQIGGLCTLEARHGEKYGWTSKYPPEHILDFADQEVQLILDEERTKQSS